MLDIARPFLARRYVYPALLLALIVAAILPWTPEYRPLGQKLAQRYTQDADRAAAAQREREAEQRRQAEANARALEEGRAAGERRRIEEAERTRQANTYEGMVAEFLRIVRVRREPVVVMVNNMNDAIQQTAAAASKPSFYSAIGLRLEETTSNLPCTDPANTRELFFDREEKRTRNILACGVYMARNSREIGEPAPQVTTALLQRVNDAAENGHYPLQTIVAYIWLQYLTQATNQARPPGELPALNTGDGFNVALFRGTLAPGFAQRLIDTANTEEKLNLSSRIYPDLRSLAELGNRIATACKELNRTPCLTSR